ncbi:Replication initiation and membrane attachment [Ruminococcaceae bacterium YRB3002]|nr:Replication initiation and membrane attachment [Ruminococcaceae bacterium YRB3002]
MNDSSQKLIVSQTALPDIFVIRYAGGLSASAIYAYLWINSFYRDSNFDLKNIYDASILSKAETDSALAELVAADLLIRNGNSFHMTDIIAREVDDYLRHERAYAMSADGIPEDMTDRNLLAESIQDTFFQGKMAYPFYSLIDKCLFEYKFEQTVVYNLFQEGLDRGCVKNSKSMKNLAREWYDKGLTTPQALAEYSKCKKAVKHAVEVMGRLTRRRLNELDLTRIERWVTDLDCSAELIEFAYKSNEFRGNIQLRHVEETLVAWTSAGIRNVEDAARYEEEHHKENKRKSDRRKGKFSGSVTGAEAGLTDTETKPATTTPEEDKPAFGSGDESAEEDSAAIDNLLDMFGGDDD